MSFSETNYCEFINKGNSLLGNLYVFTHVMFVQRWIAFFFSLPNSLGRISTKWIRIRYKWCWVHAGLKPVSFHKSQVRCRSFDRLSLARWLIIAYINNRFATVQLSKRWLTRDAVQCLYFVVITSCFKDWSKCSHFSPTNKLCCTRQQYFLQNRV